MKGVIYGRGTIDVPEKQKEIIISKEDAVFWMDKNGRWHNTHGEFEHKRVIDYFNQSIDWDAEGFFISQIRGEIMEKVYFKYEDTALFAVDVIEKDDTALILNTGREITLNPQDLFIRQDCLFMTHAKLTIKFTDRAMLKLSRYMNEKNGRLSFSLKGEEYPITML